MIMNRYFDLECGLEQELDIEKKLKTNFGTSLYFFYFVKFVHFCIDKLNMEIN